MMQAQKLLIFALIAGLLVLQLIPPTLGRGTGTPSASEETESETDTDTNSGGISATCGISIGNAIIQEINRLLTSAAQGAALCPSQCDMGVGQCILCILTILTPLPVIPLPASLPGCT